MDTWHILEQRFHDIGNRDHDVAMTFEEMSPDVFWYSLHGPGQKYEGNGVWRITIIGAPKKGLPVRGPVLEKEHYSVEELEETLLRAGRLLNKEEGRNDRDAAGAYRFVKLLVKHYGSRSANNLLYENGDDKFFVNAARICGMLAGKFATLPKRIPDPPAAATSVPLFGMTIHQQSKTVTRVDSLGIERTCEIVNLEQWDLFNLALKHNGKLSKAQVHNQLPNKDDRNNTASRLRARLQEIQLTFNADNRCYILKEFFE